ncbi:MAG: cadherin-like domain-containing protein [Candidatus Thiodiazotropha sp. (ex Dulcina madagascariensis)]|nr:cadherin-like domain-containing protein [Candidatus Thiodiazotropha sp. (ex Dulcina madagascariensis)]MCU7929078.1 cadherin-like domain-containing protein [Candidatus Thiodiazotropha sp. (ex Dulcina madagascariensis)]
MIPQQIKITIITSIFILLFSACNKTDSGNNDTSTNNGSSNGAPTANSLSVSSDEDTPLAILLTGSDPDSGDSLTFMLLSSPVNGLLSGSAPNLTYTPNQHFNGSDSFTFKVSDGSLDSAAATVSITLNEVYNWINIGPHGGYISSVTFHPTVSGEIWISGDDSSGFYRSIDGGDNWSLMTTPPADQATYAIDSFASDATSLGLAAVAPGKFFASAAFDPANPATLLVGSGTGEFYVTHNYRPDGVGVTWREVASPAQSVQINDIVIVNDGTTSTWYANGWAGDLTIQPDSTPGLMRSDDGGASWTFLNAGLYPSTLIWKFRKSATVADHFYAGMWGGGFMRFEE